MRRHRGLLAIGGGGVLLVLTTLLLRWRAAPGPVAVVAMRPGLDGMPSDAPMSGGFGGRFGAGLRAATADERRGATASIKAQLEAFRRDDYRKAAQYQSSGLRRGFASVEAFRSMIRSQYPQFAFYKSVEFGPARADAKGHRVVVPVRLVGSDGVRVRALYVMVRENKMFRVEGVQSGGPMGAPRPGRRPRTPPALDA